MIGFKLCTQISSDIFSINMSYLFVTTILWRVLKMFFAQKQSKTDYSKNIRKEESCRHPFICLLVHCISVKKDYWNFSSANADIKATIKNAVKDIEKDWHDLCKISLTFQIPNILKITSPRMNLKLLKNYNQIHQL